MIIKKTFFTLIVIVLLSTNSYSAGTDSTAKVKSDYDKAVTIIKSAKKYEKKGKTEKLPEANLKMGLSGTPFNTDDGSGIGDIELANYFGEVCDKYEIAEALRDGVLTPYDYIPICCYLNEEELEEVREWEKKMAQAGRDEDGMPSEASNIASGGRNRLLAKIEDKFIKFTKLIKKPETSRVL